MTGSRTHPRVEYRLLPAGKTAGRRQDRKLGKQRRSCDAEIRERVEYNRKSGEMPDCGDRYRRPSRRRRNIPGAAASAGAVRRGTPGRLGEAVKEPVGPARKGPTCFPRSRVRRHRSRVAIMSGVRLAGDALLSGRRPDGGQTPRRYSASRRRSGARGGKTRARQAARRGRDPRDRGQRPHRPGYGGEREEPGDQAAARGRGARPVNRERARGTVA